MVTKRLRLSLWRKTKTMVPSNSMTLFRVVKMQNLSCSMVKKTRLNRAAPEGIGAPDKLFKQEGRKVFKEVVPMVSEMIITELDRLSLKPEQLRRLWLHQANANMNRLISSKVLGHEASDDESPTVLDEYANTSSAGSIIAFHKHSADFKPGERGLICSFGAGYSVGAVFVEKAG